MLEVAEQVEDRRLHRHVEGRDRLVGDQERGRDRERPREPDPLALTAGELVRVAMPDLGPQPDTVEELDHAPIESRRARNAVQPERLADDLRRTSCAG